MTWPGSRPGGGLRGPGVRWSGPLL